MQTTYRYLLPALAEAGYRAVAPFHRRFAPTELPDDLLCVRYRIVHISRSRGAVMSAGEGAARRTRGESRERAILSAVIGLLGEAGYEAMTMDAVAARAHASKTTIYRRWPGKAELVHAAVDAHIAGRVPGTHDTGSLRGDLLAVMQAVSGHLTPDFTAMMSGLVHAMRADSGMSLPDYDVLTGLSVADGGRMPITVLAAQIGWERSRVSHHVRRMGKVRENARIAAVFVRLGAFASAPSPRCLRLGARAPVDPGGARTRTHPARTHPNARSRPR